MIIGENIFAMLLREEFFGKPFTKEIPQMQRNYRSLTAVIDAVPKSM